MPRARGTGLLSIDSSEQFLHSARRRRAELLVESNRLRELLSDELVALHQFAIRCKRPLDALGVATTQLVVLLAWQRGPRFRRVLLTLVEDLFDVVGWPYDGVDHVVLDDVHETMLDPAKSDHPLAALGVVAQTPCDVAANLNLHSRLAEINIAAVAQFKAHHVLQQSTNGSSAIEQGDDRRRRGEFSAGQNRDCGTRPEWRFDQKVDMELTGFVDFQALLLSGDSYFVQGSLRSARHSITEAAGVWVAYRCGRVLRDSST
jgi:hypothetical protein